MALRTMSPHRTRDGILEITKTGVRSLNSVSVHLGACKDVADSTLVLTANDNSAVTFSARVTMPTLAQILGATDEWIAVRVLSGAS